MEQNGKLSFTLRFFIGLASFGLALYFMNQAASMINSLLLSWVIVLSASPLLFWLKSKKAPDWLAFVLTLMAIILVFGALIIMLVVAMDRLIAAVPTYADALENTKQALADFLISLGINRLDVSILFDLLEPGELVGVAASFLSGLVGALSNVVLVLLIVIFLLVDAFSIPAKVTKAIESGNQYVRRIADFGKDIRQYVYITTIVGLATGILDTIFFLIMGVDFAVLWGILAFLLSYIPTIGFWLAAIPPTLLAMLESGPLAGLVVFLGIVLINGFAENVVKPRYMGKGLNLSPFVVVFSVIFWSAILGPLGAILSIPVTLIIKELVLEVDPQNQWLADVMSAGVTAARPAAPEENVTTQQTK
jgi:predicted PurR-regulated permease PerM